MVRIVLKKLLISLLLLISFYSCDFPPPPNPDVRVRVSWCPNTEGDLAGYNLYSKRDTVTVIPSIDQFDTKQAVTDTSVLFPSLDSTRWTYSFAVTAYDTNNNESTYEKQIYWPSSRTPVPGAPQPPDPTTPSKFDTLLATDSRLNLQGVEIEQRSDWGTPKKPVVGNAVLKVPKQTKGTIDFLANSTLRVKALHFWYLDGEDDIEKMDLLVSFPDGATVRVFTTVFFWGTSESPGDDSPHYLMWNLAEFEPVASEDVGFSVELRGFRENARLNFFVIEYYDNEAKL